MSFKVGTIVGDSTIQGLQFTLAKWQDRRIQEAKRHNHSGAKKVYRPLPTQPKGARNG